MAAAPSGRDEQSPPAQTLGDLLYANPSKRPVPESDWVELVRSVGAGDELALHALYVRTRRIVFTLIMRITGNRETSEEVMLDVFHDVWRRASTYDPAGGPVIGWIMNQARSRAIDRVRFDGRKKRVGDGTDHPVTDGSSEGPHESFDVKERSRRLRQALETLGPREREAIEVAFFSELTYAEAAARLNQPLGTVKTRIRSGLATLRRAFDGD